MRRIAAALGAAAAGCGDAAPAPTPGLFADVSNGSGLDLRNVNGDVRTKPTILESLGQGAAVLDFDGDGALDVFVANGDTLKGQPPGATPRTGLFRQVAPFRFEDVSAAAGLALRGWFQGAYAADVDADGDPDLFLTAWGRSRFLRNRGDGTFVDATDETGLGVAGWSSGAAFFDADGDGDLDLYVARYVELDPDRPPNGGKPCGWKGLAVACGPHGLPALADVFLEQVDGRFVDATAKFAFDRVKPSYGLGVVAFDFDGDRDADLYVANDSVANFLFENRGGIFVDVAAEMGCDHGEGGRAQAGMGVDAADVDGDRRPDVFVTNFDEDVNTLYRNECDGKVRAFFNATGASGLGPPSFRKMGWGCRFFDVDDDGRSDLVVANGHIYPQVDGSATDASYAQENQLFLNAGLDARGLVRFAVADGGPFFRLKRSSRGLLTADFDDDLDLDLLTVEMDATPSLGRNDAPRRGPRLGVLLRGAGKNRDAIGAVLDWTDGAGVARRLERTYGGGFYSTSDPRLVATVGAAGFRAASVRFPSGRTVDIPVSVAGGYATVDEATGTVVPTPPRAARPR
jgi:hypothetical protein